MCDPQMTRKALEEVVRLADEKIDEVHDLVIKKSGDFGDFSRRCDDAAKEMSEYFLQQMHQLETWKTVFTKELQENSRTSAMDFERFRSELQEHIGQLRDLRDIITRSLNAGHNTSLDFIYQVHNNLQNVSTEVDRLNGFVTSCMPLKFVGRFQADALRKEEVGTLERLVDISAAQILPIRAPKIKLGQLFQLSFRLSATHCEAARNFLAFGVTLKENEVEQKIGSYLQDNRDGTYNLSFPITGIVPHTVHISYLGQHIRNSPYTILFKVGSQNVPSMGDNNNNQTAGRRQEIMTWPIPPLPPPSEQPEPIKQMYRPELQSNNNSMAEERVALSGGSNHEVDKLEPTTPNGSPPVEKIRRSRGRGFHYLMEKIQDISPGQTFADLPALNVLRPIDNTIKSEQSVDNREPDEENLDPRAETLSIPNSTTWRAPHSHSSSEYDVRDVKPSSENDPYEFKVPQLPTSAVFRRGLVSAASTIHDEWNDRSSIMGTSICNDTSDFNVSGPTATATKGFLPDLSDEWNEKFKIDDSIPSSFQVYPPVVGGMPCQSSPAPYRPKQHRQSLQTSSLRNGYKGNKPRASLPNNGPRRSHHSGEALPEVYEAELIGKIEGDFKFPIGVGCTPDMTLFYVCDTGNSVIKVFSGEPDFKLVGEFGADANLRRPSSVLVAPDGEVIFLKDDTAVRVWKMMTPPKPHTKGCWEQLHMTNMQKVRLYGLVMTSDGRLVTLEPRGRQLIHLNQEACVIQGCPYQPLIGCENYAQSKCRFLERISGDRLVCSDLGLSEIYLTTAEGVWITRFGGKGNGLGQFVEPSGITWNAGSCVFIADSRNNRIQVFDEEGEVRGVVKASAKSVRPSDILLCPDKNTFLVMNYILHHIKIYTLKEL